MGEEGRREWNSWAAYGFALGLSAGHTGLGAFDEAGAFLFGDPGKDVDEEGADRAGGVEPWFGVGDEADVEVVEFEDGGNDLVNVAAEAVDGPDEDGVDVALAGVVEEAGELRAVSDAGGCLVFVDGG